MSAKTKSLGPGVLIGGLAAFIWLRAYLTNFLASIAATSVSAVICTSSAMTHTLAAETSSISLNIGLKTIICFTTAF